MEVTVGAVMIAVGLIVSLPGVWLVKRFDKQAGYSGIGNPYPFSGIWYIAGILAVLTGGFLVVFGIAMIN